MNEREDLADVIYRNAPPPLDFDVIHAFADAAMIYRPRCFYVVQLRRCALMGRVGRIKCIRRPPLSPLASLLAEPGLPVIGWALL